ncbi:MAG: thioredoxin family protein [Planctomycetota bacterium]|nr:thioredoxin family protein [Planctomycetota bacterium]
MCWRESLDAALQAAQPGRRPILLAIGRLAEESDSKALDRLASWPAVVFLSQEQVAAVRLAHDDRACKDLYARFRIKSLPFVAWLDEFGNPVLVEPFPESAERLTAIVAQWPSMLARIDRYFKNHLERADLSYKRGKLRDAYLQFERLAAFKGAHQDAARAGMLKVEHVWQSLLDRALKLPPEQIEQRDLLLKGIREETIGLPFVLRLLELPAAQAEAPPGADAAQAAAGDAQAAAGDAKASGGAPAAPAPEPALSQSSLEQPPPEKALAELASAPSAAPPVQEEVSLNLRFLMSRQDEGSVEALKKLREGLACYRGALQPERQDPAERNRLLEQGFAAFDRGIECLNGIKEFEGNREAQALIEHVSMLMYGCMKYRSL